jgi:hypothetical protein
VRLSGDHVQAGLLRGLGVGYALESGDEIALFDTNGQHTLTLGGPGPGPGEFNRIQALVSMPGSRIGVIESNPPRLTVVANDYSIERVVPLPVAIRRDGALLLPDGSLVLMGGMPTRELLGHPMARVGIDGEILGFFGQNEVESDGPLRGQMLPRHLAFDGQRIFALTWYRYSVEVWSIDGVLEGRMEPDADWFSWPPEATADSPHEASAPESYFRGMQVDEDRRLWIVAQIPGENWRSAVREGQVGDRDAWLDTWIEVIDLETEKVICSGRVAPFVLGGFVGDRRIASYAERSDGEPEITVWQLSIQ